MHRRTLLTGTASLSLAVTASCLGSSDDTDRTGNGEPIDADPAELLLSPEVAESALGTEWEVGNRMDGRYPLMYRDVDVVERLHFADRPIDDADVNQIRNGVGVFETVEAAKESYAEHPYTEHGHEDADVAAESLAGIAKATSPPSKAMVRFRDANVIGGVSYHLIDTDDDDLLSDAITVAAAMHGSWRE